MFSQWTFLSFRMSRCCIQTLNFEPLGVSKGKGKLSPVSLGFVLRGPYISVQQFIAIYSVVVEIFKSGQNDCHYWSSKTKKYHNPRDGL